MTSGWAFILFVSFLGLGLVGPIAIHGLARLCAVRGSRPGQFDLRRFEPHRLGISSLDFPGAAPEPRPGLFEGEIAALRSASHRETPVDLSWSGR